MIEPDRLISADTSISEERFDRALRPTALAEYVGQPAVKEQLQIFIEAARKRGEPLDHTLVFGPPGLGKTTLAHIVAHHAGYNVVEINASDDRSLQAFKIKLDAATQMKSVNNADQRPNCLIIDEIDGSPAATVNYLVKYLEGKHSENNKKKKSNNELLSRPIICICNDLYVPSLRPLRQVSLLLQFPPTSSQSNNNDNNIFP